MHIINEYGNVILIITALAGLLMAFGIGANDVANAMGTSVGSGTITARQAIYIAVVFEFAGAYLAGGEVTSTIKGGIIDPHMFAEIPDTLVLGMMASLFAAGIWLLVASRRGWPVSTTHSIIGAIIGFGCITIGPSSVDWSNLRGIIGSWFITPVISGVIAYIIFVSTQRVIFRTEDPLINAKKYGPYYMGITVFVLTLVTVKKGLKHIGLHLDNLQTTLISACLAVIAIYFCIRYFRSESFNKRTKGNQFGAVEKVFSILMLLTACSMAFAHGSNDVANAIGPLSAVAAIISDPYNIDASSKIAWWILPLGGLGIVLGLSFMGYKVMGTIGSGITDLTPSRGFSAEFATAITVVVASGTGLPISTTQTLVGAVLGVGLARGIAALNLKIIRNIITSWVITLPAGMLISIIVYYILVGIFNAL